MPNSRTAGEERCQLAGAAGHGPARPARRQLTEQEGVRFTQHGSYYPAAVAPSVTQKEGVDKFPGNLSTPTLGRRKKDASSPELPATVPLDQLGALCRALVSWEFAAQSATHRRHRQRRPRSRSTSSAPCAEALVSWEFAAQSAIFARSRSLSVTAARPIVGVSYGCSAMCDLSARPE